MSQDETNDLLGRRGFIAGLGTVCGLGTVGAMAAGATTESAPPIAWRRTYSGDDDPAECTLQSVISTRDGGFLLAGDGVPDSEDSTLTDQLVAIRTDASGAVRWRTFIDDDTTDTTSLSFGDVVQTDDDGFVLVGHASNVLSGDDDATEGEVARAVKLDPSGQLQWLVGFDGFEENEESDMDDTGSSDDALFLTAIPTADGGIVAGGTIEGEAWLTALGPDGTTSWQRRYDGFSVPTVWRQTDGFGAIVDRDEGYVLQQLDENGTSTRSSVVDIDYQQTPYNHVFTPLAEGGVAYTGRDAGRENLVLGTVDTDGNPVWRTEYDGPVGQSDWGRRVTQLADGGLLLGGYATVDETGETQPVILNADQSGTEQWRRYIDSTAASNVFELAEAADGRIACLLGSGSNTLVTLESDRPSGLSLGEYRPTDLDNDGLYEDIDGDGDGDIFDALTYYNNRESEAIRSNPQYYDFDGDGDAGDIFDAIALYNDL